MNTTRPRSPRRAPAGAPPSLAALASFARASALLVTTLLFTLLTTGLVGGCASTAESESLAARVTMRQFTGNQVAFELRSESHTDAVEFYSRPRSDANVKIISDVLMEGLLRDLDQYGFDDWANPGPGPQSGLGGITKVVEVEIDGAVRHAASHPNAGADQINAVVQMAIFVSSAFSSVHGFQSVDEPQRGAGIFSGPGLDG